MAVAARADALIGHQGNRADLHPADLDTALSIDDTATAIAAAPTTNARMRLFFEFLRGSDAAGPAAMLLVSQEPAPQGTAASMHF